MEKSRVTSAVRARFVISRSKYHVMREAFDTVMNVWNVKQRQNLKGEKDKYLERKNFACQYIEQYNVKTT